MTRIIHKKWFHKLIHLLKIQYMTKWILQKVSPTFKYKNINYRIKSPESFSIAKEIFHDDTYSQFLLKIPIETFIDIGCNTGFFTCLLAAYNDAELLNGILVDADRDVLEETKWHLQINNLTKCRTTYAIVGPADASAVFYISDFNISSSAIPFDETYPFPIRAMKKIETPVVSLEQLIRTNFGAKRVNILKIDIEGSEVDLLKQDLTCLSQVDWIILEWHKWLISVEDVSGQLSRYDFALIRILKEDTICGLALYKNQSTS